jgi:Zn-dependent M16 (insulinase) family peptidase
MFHQVPSNGIVHINAYFPITQLALDELPAAALITEFFRDLPTDKYDVFSLQNEIRMYIGGISFGLDILAKDNDYENCTPCIRVRASVLEDKLSNAEELITGILTGTKFDDKQMMRELITQIDEDSKRTAMANGHRLGLFEARSHWSARDAAAEAINGHGFMRYMHRMAGASDEELDEFTAFANLTIKKSINRNNATLSETASEYADISGLTGMLPEGEKQAETAHYVSALPRRMGIQIPAAVSFSVQAYDMASAALKMNGSMSVTANIISLAHLWNAIRVQGGAYGASMSAGRTGSLYCYTYRDPSPSRSLEVLKTIPDFITEFASQADLGIEGFIISTIASTEPLLSPAAKGRAADDFLFSGFTDEDRIRFRQEMLGTTAEDLLAQKEALEHLASEGCICVVGPKAALEECADLEIFEL